MTADRTIEIRFPLDLLEAAIKEAFERQAYGSLKAVIEGAIWDPVRRGSEHALRPLVQKAVADLLADADLAAAVRAAVREGLIDGARDAGRTTGRKAAGPVAQMLIDGVKP